MRNWDLSFFFCSIEHSLDLMRMRRKLRSSSTEAWERLLGFDGHILRRLMHRLRKYTWIMYTWTLFCLRSEFPTVHDSCPCYGLHMSDDHTWQRSTDMRQELTIGARSERNSNRSEKSITITTCEEDSIPRLESSFYIIILTSLLLLLIHFYWLSLQTRSASLS